MESPIRKYQKQKEYQRHKVLRKIKRRQQRKAEQMQKIAEKQLKRGLPKMDEGTEPEDDEFRYAQLPNGITVRFKSSSFQNGTYANYDNPKQRFQLDGTIDAQQAKRKSAFRPEDVPAYANALMGGFPLNLSLSQWARRGYDAMTGNLTPESWFGGNNGIVSDEFAKEHPYLSTAANLATDLIGFGAIKLARSTPKQRLTALREEYPYNPYDTATDLDIQQHPYGYNWWGVPLKKPNQNWFDYAKANPNDPYVQNVINARR